MYFEPPRAYQFSLLRMTKDQLTPAIDRLFRAYANYCSTWNEDALFQVLTALHSLDDRLRERHGRVLFDIPEYIALKALRNYYHHRGEVENVLRVKPLQGLVASTDLMHGCLVARADVKAAIAATDTKYQAAAQKAIEATFKRWGEVYDINPCVFNAIVRVFETLRKLGCAGASEDWQQFEEQYDWEDREGHSHFVTGAVVLHPNQASEYAHRLEGLYGRR